MEKNNDLSHLFDGISGDVLDSLKHLPVFNYVPSFALEKARIATNDKIYFLYIAGIYSTGENDENKKVEIVGSSIIVPTGQFLINLPLDNINRNIPIENIRKYETLKKLNYEAA